jgi:peptide/nickel transport system permease protein
LRAYLTRRLLLFVPTLLVVAAVVFALLRLIPGDVAELVVLEAGAASGAARTAQIQRIRRELALDQPVGVQFARWLGNAARGDLGRSFADGRPVRDILAERLPRSVELATLTMTFALMWAVPFGAVAATRRGTWVDHALRVVATGALSLPVFFSGVLILYGLVRVFRWLPPLGYVGLFEDPARNAAQVVWPALAQALYVGAPIARLLRSYMLDAFQEEYVRVAWAKGLAVGAVVGRHVLRNAALPMLAVVGAAGGRVLGGIVVVETVFAVPGMGSALAHAVAQRDYPTLQAIMLVMAFLFLSLNVAIDAVHAWLDPRIRLT